MDQIDKHRRDFMKFVDDCAVYCIEKSGLLYPPLHNLEGAETYFKSDYGDAVLQYNGAHDEMYRKRIRKKPLNEFLTTQGLLVYMNKGIKKCFDEKHPIMEGILMFCSLFIDTAIFCFRYEKADLIHSSLISTIYFVFDEHVAKLFILADPSIVPAMWEKIVDSGMALVETEKRTVPTGRNVPAESMNVPVEKSKDPN